MWYHHRQFGFYHIYMYRQKHALGTTIENFSPIGNMEQKDHSGGKRS